MSTGRGALVKIAIPTDCTERDSATKILALTAKSTASTRTLDTSVTVLVADFAVFQVDETAHIAAEIKAARVAAEAARVATEAEAAREAAAQHAAAPGPPAVAVGAAMVAPAEVDLVPPSTPDLAEPPTVWVEPCHAPELRARTITSPTNVRRRTGPRHLSGDAPNPLNPLRSPGFMGDSFSLSHAKEAAAASHFCSSPLRLSDIAHSPVNRASHRSAYGHGKRTAQAAVAKDYIFHPMGG